MGIDGLILGKGKQGDTPVEQILIAGFCPEDVAVSGVIHPRGNALTASLGKPEADGVGGGIAGLIVGKATV